MVPLQLPPTREEARMIERRCAQGGAQSQIVCPELCLHVEGKLGFPFFSSFSKEVPSSSLAVLSGPVVRNSAP